MVARWVRDSEAASSSLATPTGMDRRDAVPANVAAQITSRRSGALFGSPAGASPTTKCRLHRDEQMFYNLGVPEPVERRPQKRCIRCGEEKELGDFHRRGDGRQSWCKTCCRDWDAAYHQRRRPIRMVQKRLLRQQRCLWLSDYKSSRPCTDCGGFFHPAAMTFDHLPGSAKRDNVSDLLRAYHQNVAMEEIAKCELVCANCHAVRTADRRRAVSRKAGDDRQDE